MKITLDSPEYKQPKIHTDFKDINMDNFNLAVNSWAWDTVFQIDNLDHKIQYLCDSMLTIIDYFAPIKTFKRNRNYKCSPWITDVVKLLQKLRNKALKNTKTNNKKTSAL